MIAIRTNSGRQPTLPLSSANDGDDAFNFGGGTSNPVAAAPKAIQQFTAPEHCLNKALCGKKAACQYVGCITHPKYHAAERIKSPQATEAPSTDTKQAKASAKPSAALPAAAPANGAAQDLAQQVGETIKRGKKAQKAAEAVLAKAMADQKANAAASGQPVKPNKGGGAKKDLAPVTQKSQTPPSAGAPAPSTTPQEDTMATKKTAAKKTAAKATPAPARAASARGFQDDQTITLISKENPKREGSVAHAVFALYKPGMTVGTFREKADKLDDNNSGAHLRWDTKKGFIKIK